MAAIASLGTHAALIGGLLLFARTPGQAEIPPPPGAGAIVFVSLVPGPDRAAGRGREVDPAQTAPPSVASTAPIVSPDPPANRVVEVSHASSPQKPDPAAPEPATVSLLAERTPASRASSAAEAVVSSAASASGKPSASGTPPAWPGPGEVDRPARPRWPIHPAYPSLARHRGEEATVVVEAWVDDGGSVAFSTVLDSGGADFDASALDAVAQSTFRPARRSGRDIASRVALRIHFELRD